MGLTLYTECIYQCICECICLLSNIIITNIYDESTILLWLLQFSDIVINICPLNIAELYIIWWFHCQVLITGLFSFQHSNYMSIDWFKRKITGQSHISWENLWFPVKIFPSTNPLNISTDPSPAFGVQHEPLEIAGGRRLCAALWTVLRATQCAWGHYDLECSKTIGFGLDSLY